MTDNLTSHELTGAEAQTFVVGMDRAAIIEAARDLDSSERVEFWSTFESTPNIPYPAALTVRAVDDISAVLSGAKPATLIDEDNLTEPSVAKLIDDEKQKFESLSQARAVDHYGNLHYFLGREENVNKLATLYHGRGGEGTPLPADEDFHRGVGEALGFSAAAIDDFIGRLKVHETKAHQPKRVRASKYLGNILLRR